MINVKELTASILAGQIISLTEKARLESMKMQNQDRVLIHALDAYRGRMQGIAEFFGISDLVAQKIKLRKKT